MPFLVFQFPQVVMRSGTGRKRSLSSNMPTGCGKYMQSAILSCNPSEPGCVVFLSSCRSSLERIKTSISGANNSRFHWPNNFLYNQLWLWRDSFLPSQLFYENICFQSQLWPAVLLPDKSCWWRYWIWWTLSCQKKKLISPQREMLSSNFNKHPKWLMLMNKNSFT
jgi:hypothetical protein